VKSIADLLADHPFFAGLPPADLALLAGCGENVHFGAGSTIFAEGDPADLFYVLRTGRVALDVNTPDRGPIMIATLTAGDVLGASWWVPPFRWQLDAVAVDEVGAVALDAACLRGKCDEDPRLGYDLVRRFAALLVQRLQATRLRLLDLYGPS
jgi:CRP-like cAMP-binding protein